MFESDFQYTDCCMLDDIVSWNYTTLLLLVRGHCFGVLYWNVNGQSDNINLNIINGIQNETVPITFVFCFSQFFSNKFHPHIIHIIKSL